MTLQSVTPDDGVGDERVRGHDTTYEEGGTAGVAQHRPGHDVGHDERYETGEQTERQELIGVLLQAFQVHLQSGEEHDIVETYTAKDLERHVALQDIETIMSHGDTCQYHADDVRDAQFAHHNRCKENDKQHHEEDQRGVGNG